MEGHFGVLSEARLLPVANLLQTYLILSQKVMSTWSLSKVYTLNRLEVVLTLGCSFEIKESEGS